MNSLLAWRAATASDRQELAHFSCTTEPVKSLTTRWKPVHSRHWEWEVQCALRGLRPPFSFPKQMLVGRDDHGLAAVSYYEELDGAAQVELSLMAVALRHRRKGKGFADEMFRNTLDAITARALDRAVSEVLVTGYVFEENDASQEMCRRHGLRHTAMASERVQTWSMNLLV